MIHRQSFYKAVPVLFFLLVLVTGIAIFRDYGVHYDEKLQINVAVNNYRYINQGDPALLTFKDRYYGIFFELPLLVLFNGLASPWMLYGRHLTVFLTFFCGLICFYFLSKRLFGNGVWALLAVGLLAIHPRIFADSFYNSKDIPFLVFFMLGITSLLYLLRLLETTGRIRPVVSTLILHSLITSAVAAIRLPGLILMALSAALILIRLFVNPAHWKRDLGLLAGYVVFSLILLTALTPIFWHDPVGEFINALSHTSRYTDWKNDVLFMGRFFPANEPVWNYLPVWMGITTPYLPLAALIAGAIWMIRTAARECYSLWRIKPVLWKNSLTAEKIGWLAIPAWFFGPIWGSMVLNTVMYDGWRQMFFLYPVMVLIGVYGIKKIWEWVNSFGQNRRMAKVIFGLVLIAGILEPISFMVINHPYENVYFNALAGDPRTLRQRFDLDYWGLSYKQAIDYVLAHDPRDYLEISAVGPPSLYVEYVLPADQASRVRFSDNDRADYLLTNYRWHPNDFPYPKYYSIKAAGMEIMTVYCLKEPCGK